MVFISYIWIIYTYKLIFMEENGGTLSHFQTTIKVNICKPADMKIILYLSVNCRESGICLSVMYQIFIRNA